MSKKTKQDRPKSRVSFTDSKAPVPQTMAVDARPMAGEMPRPMGKRGAGAFGVNPPAFSRDVEEES